MAGLNCGTVSLAAWPWLVRGIDAVVTVEDEGAREAMRALAAEGVVAGETGAAGAAALLELVAGGELAAAAGRERPRVLLLSTEGATDPVSWQRIVGREP
jgi:diaminopropionate ammonia-lyase